MQNCKIYYFNFLSIIIYCSLSLIVCLNVQSMQSRHEIDSLAYLKPVFLFEETGSCADSTKATNIMSLGYPYFLIGVRTILGHSYNVIIVAQIILALLSLYFLYSFAQLLFSVNIAAITLFLASFNFALLIYPHFFLTEMLTCFLFIFALEQFCRFYYYETWYSLAFSGLSFGYSLVVKGAAILYIPLLLLFIVYKYKDRLVFGMKNALLFFLCIVTPVVLYSLRNKSVYDHFYFQSLTQPILYFFFLEKMIQSSEHLSPKDASKKINYLTRNVTEYASGDGWEEAQAYFFKTCYRYPHIVISLWLKNVLKNFLGLFTNQLRVLLYYPYVKGGDCSLFKFHGSLFEKVKSYLIFGDVSYTFLLIEIFEIIFLFIRYLLVLLSFIYLIKQQEWFIVFLFGAWVIYFPLVAGHDGCARYRTMIELQLTLLAAVGCAIVWNMVSAKKVVFFTK